MTSRGGTPTAGKKAIKAARVAVLSYAVSYDFQACFVDSGFTPP